MTNQTIIKLFNLQTQQPGSVAWLVAADYLEEQDIQPLATAFRQGLWFADFSNSDCSSNGSGYDYGNGSGDGNGYGDGYGLGNGCGTGNGRGRGNSHGGGFGRGHGDGYGNGYD